GRIRAVSFMALGKYRVQCGINDRNLVERIQTYFPNPVVGDLYYELVLTNYKDFGNGLMFPVTFHQHHDLDDDLEGEGVNVSGGHNSFGLTVASVQPNPAGAAPTVPDAARTATIPPVREGRSEVRADRRNESHGDLQRPGSRARAGHADGLHAEGKDRRRGGSLHAAGAGHGIADDGRAGGPDVLQQRAAAEAGRADDCADPRRAYIP